MSPPDDTPVDGPENRPHPRRERAVVLFADSAGSLIRAGDEVPDEDSLPVLTAFRQFLEAERRRARRQMAALVAACLVTLAGAAGGGAWYLRSVLRRVESAIEADQTRNEESRLAVVSNLQGVARTAVTLRQDVLDTRKTSLILRDRVAEQTDELARLLDTITTLEIQNSLMQRSLRKLDEPRAFVAAPAALEPRTEPEPPRPGPESRVRLSAPPSRAEPLPAVSPPPPPAPVFEAVATPPPVPEPRSAIVSGATPGGVPYRLPLPRE